MLCNTDLDHRHVPDQLGSNRRFPFSWLFFGSHPGSSSLRILTLGTAARAVGSIRQNGALASCPTTAPPTTAFASTALNPGRRAFHSIHSTVLPSTICGSIPATV